MYKRLFITAIAIVYGALCGGIPAAHALNTDLWVGLCNPCSTTQEFETAAYNLVASKEKGVIGTTHTYTAIMSNLANSTAFISVTGTWNNAFRRGVVLDLDTAIPVDANGNSLANESEAYLENYYTQVDWTVFAASRSDPLAVYWKCCTRFCGHTGHRCFGEYCEQWPSRRWPSCRDSSNSDIC